jgi:thiol-disulfide isomerase/thioredoxin
MGRRTLIVVAIACLAAIGGWRLQQHWLNTPPTQPPPAANTRVLRVGDMVGDYALPRLNGASTALAKWRGKVVLLNFWATWCAPCREEMPMLAKAQSAHARDGLQIVGVAMNQPQSAVRFLQQVPVGFPILIGIDADPAPPTTFGDTSGLLPYSVLIGRNGRILKTNLGALNPTLIRHWLDAAKAAQTQSVTTDRPG